MLKVKFIYKLFTVLFLMGYHFAYAADSIPEEQITVLPGTKVHGIDNIKVVNVSDLENNLTSTSLQNAVIYLVGDVHVVAPAGVWQQIERVSIKTDDSTQTAADTSLKIENQIASSQPAERDKVLQNFPFKNSPGQWQIKTLVAITTVVSSNKNKFKLGSNMILSMNSLQLQKLDLVQKPTFLDFDTSRKVGFCSTQSTRGAPVPYFKRGFFK
jgi:hypothetical protein